MSSTELSPLSLPSTRFPSLSFQQQVGALYQQHQSWLLAWLNKKLHCHALAADLSQDTFMRLLNKPHLPELNEPRAFLMTLAKRVVCNHWRREQLEQAYLAELAQAPEQFVLSEEERAILFETLYEIDRLLDGLAPIVRQVFLMAQLDGLRQREIAEQLDISVSTVKRYLVRASAQCFFAITPEASYGQG